MTDLTPEQIQQAREIAQTVISYPYRVLTGEGTTLARAVLALTEQQTEPVSRGELVNLFNVALPINAETNWLIDRLMSNFDITRKQPEGADHG